MNFFVPNRDILKNCVLYEYDDKIVDEVWRKITNIDND